MTDKIINVALFVVGGFFGGAASAAFFSPKHDWLDFIAGGMFTLLSITFIFIALSGVLPKQEENEI